MPLCQSCGRVKVRHLGDLCPACEANVIRRRKPAESASDNDDKDEPPGGGITEIVSVVPVRGRLGKTLDFLEMDGHRQR
jgi:hypothetical protein